MITSLSRSRSLNSQVSYRDPNLPPLPAYRPLVIRSTRTIGNMCAYDIVLGGVARISAAKKTLCLLWEIVQVRYHSGLSEMPLSMWR